MCSIWGAQRERPSSLQWGAWGRVRFVLESTAHPNQRRLPGGEGPWWDRRVGDKRPHRFSVLQEVEGRWDTVGVGSLLGVGELFAGTPILVPEERVQDPSRTLFPSPAQAEPPSSAWGTVPVVQTMATRWHAGLRNAVTKGLAEMAPERWR